MDIKPNQIQLNTLDRPGTVADIHAASHKDLKKIVDYWNLDHVEIIAAAPNGKIFNHTGKMLKLQF